MAAAAARSFGPEREAEPAKEARVVGSELVDTYTVCRGRGRRSRGWRLEPESGSRGWGGGLGPAIGRRGPGIGKSGEGSGLRSPGRGSWGGLQGGSSEQGYAFRKGG